MSKIQTTKTGRTIVRLYFMSPRRWDSGLETYYNESYCVIFEPGTVVRYAEDHPNFVISGGEHDGWIAPSCPLGAVVELSPLEQLAEQA